LGRDQFAKRTDLHYDHGVVLGEQEQWDRAAEAYRRALAVNPLHARARNNLGHLLERRREYEEAAAEYRQAVAAQPPFRLARFNLGRMLLALGRNDEAAAELEKLRYPEDQESPRYVFALATAYVRAGRRAEGLELSREARRLAMLHGQTELAAAIDREMERLK
jgi:tetratricopeptide (TPR) repeat protein